MATALRRSRRRFLLAAPCTGSALALTAIARGGESPAAEDIAPPEDLMREHGVLRRILLIYEECGRRLHDGKGFQPATLNSAAKIVRTFIEDYHEKLEEDHLFPRFEKAGKLTDLVKALREQHDAGRRLTNGMIELASPATMQDAQGRLKLCQTMEQFIRMYRPHAAREDTVLFPALRSVMTAKEFDEMGDNFEDREHELFGKEGFEGIVEKVADMEKKLGINDLGQFTPKS